MKANTMQTYGSVFLLISVICIGYEVVTGVKLSGTWPMIIIMNIYFVAGEILESIESIKELIK